jgi:hypothetical protein
MVTRCGTLLQREVSKPTLLELLECWFDCAIKRNVCRKSTELNQAVM